MAGKHYLGIDVLSAARQRIAWTFDTFPHVYVSYSGGKDSAVMLHLVADEARKRSRTFGLMFVDLEAQYKLTIDHIAECYALYADCTDPYWVALPLNLRNAVSQYEPQWLCWDAERKTDWVREPPKLAITDLDYFPFFHSGMEFEEFVPLFGEWYGQGQPTACLVGIRTAESLNRWRTIAEIDKRMYERRRWTTQIGDGDLYNVYPIYDWQTQDIWTYFAKSGKPYNRLYDRMQQAGLSIHQMRICQPYGDDQRKGLWLFQIIEPETWARVVARVNGANQGALYAQESGNILGMIKISKPPQHTWQSFAMMLLGSMPDQTAEHYRNKIAVFLHWYEVRGYPNGIPDDGPLSKSNPSWLRVCKALLRNDYWCKGLSFSQQNSQSNKKYFELMRRRRDKWRLI